jgi:hypothetical protein
MLKKILIIVMFFGFNQILKSQTCDEYIKLVKSKSFGTTYSSYTSEAISSVTFYDLIIDYKTYNFAIVCFKSNKYAYNCTEYIYLVGSNTKFNYSVNYQKSAGQAFWDYIHPYSENLGCSPNFE